MFRPNPQHAAGDGPDPDGMLLVVIGEPPRARLQVVGDLSSATAPRLAHLLRGLLDAGYGQVDLDLSCLEVLGAAG
jgi:hypothetical protein